MRIIREAVGGQRLYRLVEGEAGCTLGEAVTSETAGGVRLHAIYVRPGHRGRGCGDLLMRTILDEGGDRPVALCTSLGNVSFFERYGFEITETGESLVSMEKKSSFGGNSA